MRFWQKIFRGFFADKRFIDLVKASANGDESAVKALLSQGVDSNGEYRDYDRAIVHAAACGQTAIVKLLVNNGAKVNFRTRPYGHTPLMMAIGPGRADLVRLLLECGADANLQTSTGDTALMSACYDRADIDIVKLLLEHEAHVNTRASRGRTALWLASQKGHVGIVSLLIEAGADIEARFEDDGYTPLIEAAGAGHSTTVSHLLEKGADVNAKANSGDIALDVARKNSRVETVQLLEKAMKMGQPTARMGLSFSGLTLIMQGHTGYFVDPDHVVRAFWVARLEFADPQGELYATLAFKKVRGELSDIPDFVYDAFEHGTFLYAENKSYGEHKGYIIMFDKHKLPVCGREKKRSGT